jgi:hypothetical protein
MLLPFPKWPPRHHITDGGFLREVLVPTTELGRARDMYMKAVENAVAQGHSPNDADQEAMKTMAIEYSYRMHEYFGIRGIPKVETLVKFIAWVPTASLAIRNADPSAKTTASLMSGLVAIFSRYLSTHLVRIWTHVEASVQRRSNKRLAGAISALRSTGMFDLDAPSVRKHVAQLPEWKGRSGESFPGNTGGSD